jgi:SAM-dependent methyltransferase
MTTSARDETAVAPWPLVRRVVVGLAQPGGPAMAGRAFDAAGLDDGSRVVDLAPGLGLATEAVLARAPRTWTGVEPDPLAAEHLRRAHTGAGRGVVIPGREAPTVTRDVVEAPVAATGLEGATATVVVIDSLLGTLPERGDRVAVLSEAARLLRAGGRVAVHDLTFAPDADPDAAPDLAAAGIHPIPVDDLRADAEAAGLVLVGSLVGRLHLPAARDVMREAGPRLGVKITREMARDGVLRSAALAGKDALPRRAVSLRSLVVVAEVPLILGMRRPRR